LSDFSDLVFSIDDNQGEAPKNSLSKKKFLSRQQVQAVSSRIITDFVRFRFDQQVDIQRQPSGKPYLLGFNQHISISHSHDFLVFVISSEKFLGVDLEFLRTDRDEQSLAKRFFHPQELKWIESFGLKNANKNNQNHQQQAFYQIWTMKEAYSKALGQGLDLNFIKNCSIFEFKNAFWTMLGSLDHSKFILTLSAKNICSLSYFMATVGASGADICFKLSEDKNSDNSFFV
jgi:phosphopantetheinyl transferase (holo-ACP synthase)